MADTNARKGWQAFTTGAVVLGFIVLFADFLANDKPIVCRCDGTWDIPVITKKNVLSDISYDRCLFVVMPPIRYSPYTIDKNNGRYTSPLAEQNVSSFWQRHWLGTDQIGRDVAAGLIHGARVSLFIGLSATFFGLLLGLPYGLFLGYFQDNGLRWNGIQLAIFTIFLSILIFYFTYAEITFFVGLLYCLLFMVIVFFLMRIAGRLTIQKYPVPLDLVGFRILEWRKSIPALFLLLALLTVFTRPSVWQVILIIGLLSWSDIARLVRAETLSIKSRLYVLTAEAMGFSHGYIIRKYILPGLKSTLLVIAVYMMAGSVLLESTLSFLGLGLPVEEVTWGKMLASSRDVKAWWMAVFPGGCLILLLFWLYKWSDFRSKR